MMELSALIPQLDNQSEQIPALLDEALRHHQRGEFQSAATVYGMILKLDPNHADATHLLGMTANQAGMRPLAINLIERAISINPNAAAYHSNLGSIYQAEGRIQDAIAAYEKAREIDPGLAEVHLNLGLALQSAGELGEAILCYRRASALKDSLAEAHSNLGNALQESGHTTEAIAAYRKALSIKHEFPEAHYNLANALQSEKRFAESAESYCHAIELRAEFPEAESNLGNVLVELHENSAAEEHFRRALKLRPNYAEAHFNLANLLAEIEQLFEAAAHFELALRADATMLRAHNNLGHTYRTLEHFAEAIEHYRALPQNDPQFIDAYNNLSLALLELGKHEEAEEAIHHALALMPELGQAHCNLGAIYHSQNRIEEARACYQKALDLNPALSKAQLNRGMIGLVCGDFARGWVDYELRWEDAPLHRRDFAEPQWRGESLAGRSILLHGEQGLGDTLQFLRYVPILQQLASKVVLEVPARIGDLAKELPGISVYLEGDTLPRCDFYSPLLSIPLMLGHTSEEKLPHKTPYLTVPAAARAKAAPLFAAPKSRLRVGINWAGNASFIHDRYRFRALPLAEFAPLLSMDEVEFYSLQMGEGLLELDKNPALKNRLVDLAPHVDSMADTAAHMEQLDLIITADTSVSHLAGALGKPTWVFIPYSPDWRWMQQRRDTPWYPTMELFRQPTPGAWSPLITEMLPRLRALATDFNR